MYVPSHFKVDSPELVRWVLEQYPFATMVTPTAEGLKVTHLPFLFDASRGEHGVLRGHVARANDHWTVFDSACETTSIFLGPHSYVSPTWYSGGGSVPTWNYASVHLYGRPQIMDEAASRVFLMDLVRYFESAGSSYDYAAGEREMGKLLPGIVAFEIEVTRVEAKFKMSQNKPEEDRSRVVEALGEGSWLDREVAAFMGRIG